MDDLEQQKMMLVAKLNDVQSKIDEYGILEIATDGGPFKDLVVEKQSIIYQIKEIKRKQGETFIP